MTVDELCHCLTRFVLETRKKNGEEYPCESLQELLLSIQTYLALQGREFQFLQDPDFVSLRNTLDARMKQLAAEGKRVKRKQAEVISADDEEQMWQKGILGSDTPQQLVDTLLYMIGLHFALRAGQEHWQLRYVDGQIAVNNGPNGRFLRYTEDISKNSQGGLAHKHVRPKCVDAYENKDNLDRCIVTLYEKYISHRPTSPKCSPALYLRPLNKPQGDVWYSCQRQGIHQITKTVKRLCSSAGLQGFFTNHSLRATAASRLYEKNFDEQLICETTGHRSSAVRSYKRTSDGQRKSISAALRSSSSTSRPIKEVSTSGANPSVNIGTADGLAKQAINITVNVNTGKPDTL